MMGFLFMLKFDYPRSHPLTIVLVHSFELSTLCLIMVNVFNHFYSKSLPILTNPFPQNTQIHLTISITLLLLVSLNLLAVTQTCKFLRFLWSPSTRLFKIYVYWLYVPLLHYSFQGIQTGPPSTILASFNSIILISITMLHEFLNHSLKFRSTDFANRRLYSFIGQGFIIFISFSLTFFGYLMAAFVCFLKGIYSLIKLYNTYQYPHIQRLKLFYAFVSLYYCSIVFMTSFGIVPSNSIESLLNSTLIIILGGFISWILSGKISLYLRNQILENCSHTGQRSDNLDDFQSMQSLTMYQNDLRMMAQVMLQRQKWLQRNEGDFGTYWKFFNEKVFVHRLRCNSLNCVCRLYQKNDPKGDWQIYVWELSQGLQGMIAIFGKESKLKLINIYLLMEVATRPLKAYYEIISLKQLKNKLMVRIQIEDLIRKTRNCFDQIFQKNKAANQQLQLLRVINFQQNLTKLQDEVRSAINQLINYLQSFSVASVNMQQVEQQSAKLFLIKCSIESKIEMLVDQNVDNYQLNLNIFVFYRMLEIYRSRQNQFKKSSIHQNMKKRLSSKNDINVFSENHGVIYIDLVEERGQIKKFTKNISHMFGYTKEEMIDHNINEYMPRIFGKYHQKFLFNFIQKGRIKLLKVKDRLVFGKNKNKFIFPMSVRIKTEHLQQHQFGASALISPIDTNSEYIMIGANGRIEEVTQGIYEILFEEVMKDEVSRINQLCAYKMILSLNELLQDYDEKNVNKIYGGLMVYSSKPNYLQQKFRYWISNSHNFSNVSRSNVVSYNEISTYKSIMAHKNQNIEYLRELFRSHIYHLDIFQLKGRNISYKYRRVKTDQFQIELVEIITIKEEIIGKALYRQLLSQLSNIVQIYQLYDRTQSIPERLQQLEQIVQSNRYKQFQNKSFDRKKFRTSFQILKPQQVPNIKDMTKRIESQRSLMMKGSEDSLNDYQLDLNEQDRRMLNPQQSQPNSFGNNNENEVKKQILINAFDSKDRSVSSWGILVGRGLIIILILLLCLLAFYSYNYASRIKYQWRDIHYDLSFQQIMEFKIALSQMKILYTNMGQTQPLFIQQQQLMLNNRMVNLATNLNSATYTPQLSDGIESFSVTLWDPVNQYKYISTIPQLLEQLVWLYQFSSSSNTQFLRENYEILHLSLNNFYDTKLKSLFEDNANLLGIIATIFGIYQSILIFNGICALPIYIYYKKEEIAVRSKLTFTNLKQVKREIMKLKYVYDFLKISKIKKKTLDKIQEQLDYTNRENQQSHKEGTRFIKIAFGRQISSLKNPKAYLLLLIFIILFSNLSATLFAFSRINSQFFTDTINLQKTLSDIEIKSPLLINIFVSNINRYLEGSNPKIFTNITYTEAESGFLSLLQILSSTPYSKNNIAEFVASQIQGGLCTMVNCTLSSGNSSLIDIILSFKSKFDYWAPVNNPKLNTSTIKTWLAQNNIENTLMQVEGIIQSSLSINDNIDLQFSSWIDSFQVQTLLIAIILIPINVMGLVLISYSFVSSLSKLLKTAESIFMHFPVNVLVENTYLITYFNSKKKQRN